MKDTNYKTNLRSVYNTIANHFSNTRSFLWPELADFLPYIRSSSHIIDIGCGNGRLIELIREKQCTYLGIDQAEDLLTEAKRKWPTFSFEPADMSTYHYGRERFDSAFFIASIHHLASFEEQLKVLKRVYTAIKSNGYVFITVWNLWQKKYKLYIQTEPYHHSYIPYTQGDNKQFRFYYAFTKTELKQLCQAAGFKIIDIWYSNKEQHVQRTEARNICLIGQKL